MRPFHRIGVVAEAAPSTCGPLSCKVSFNLILEPFPNWRQVAMWKTPIAEASNDRV